MKGPFERLKYDLRRVWECPACQRRERTPGTVTFRFCSCTSKQPGCSPTPMKLVEDGAVRVGPPIVIHHEPLEPPAPLLPPPETAQIVPPDEPAAPGI